jgi:hypothetical protein
VLLPAVREALTQLALVEQDDGRPKFADIQNIGRRNVQQHVRTGLRRPLRFPNLPGDRG